MVLAVAVSSACAARSELDVPVAPTCGFAASFDHFGDDVFLSGLNATPPSGFTWDFWFTARTVPSSTAVDLHLGATLMVAADSAGCEDIFVGFGSVLSPANALAFTVDGVGGCAARDTAPIAFVPDGGFIENRWYFVAVSHDYASGQSRLYLDGTLVASKVATVAAVTRTLPVTIGRWFDRANYEYNELDGAIDELHVFDHALTDEEVSVEYGGGAGSYATSVGGLVAGYHFDEGGGTTASPITGSVVGDLEKSATWQPGFVCPH
jgi:hypothetical protein